MVRDRIEVRWLGHTLVFDSIGHQLFLTYHPYWMINRKKDRHYLYCSHAAHKNIPFHRILLNHPDGDVDHKNHNGLDNRKENLRHATRQQNSFNTRKRSNNTSGFKGVSYCKSTDKWVARIRIGNTYKNLGRFPTPEEAHAAYCLAGKQHMPEFFCDGTST